MPMAAGLYAGSGNTHIATLVERQSRLTLLVKVNGKDTASVVMCSGVITLLPAPASLPALAALTQLRSVCSDMPYSRAMAAMPRPPAIHATACSLNSIVYSCFGDFIVSLPANQRFIPSAERRNSR